MKRFLGLILISIVAFGCQNEPKRTDYIINGTAKDVFNGIRVYINELDERNRLVAIDTAMVMNESFSFEGKVDYPRLFTVTIDGTVGRFDVMLENSEMQLTIDKSIISNSQLTGSESQMVISEYNAQMKANLKKFSEAQETLKNSQFLNDQNFIPKDRENLEQIRELTANYPYKFIIENKNSYAILPIITAQFYNRGLEPEKLINAVESIDTTLKNTEEWNVISKRINTFKVALEAERVTAIGAKAPDFSAPNPDGKIVSLNDVVSKGKITIIDFWAAWCGPCRRENPNIVKIYEKYHDKGLEIIGVGLDGARNQKNPKEAWVKAIEDDNLTWTQVSNLNYFDEIAKTYNVRAIPAMFVLDAKGEIIAKDLRGPALENKIAELLN